MRYKIFGRHTGRAEEGRLTRLGVLIHSETTQRNTAILDTVHAIATEAEATPTRVAIAWLRSKAAASAISVIPILGPRSAAQLDDASAVPLGFPHEFLANERNRKRLAGGRPDLIDLERVPAA
jgi:aryl-alcohol dehydrogenase-like predicted oxidoreductase